MLAKALLGAFLFLFVASFLVLPCMQDESALFVSIANAPARASLVVPSGPASKAVQASFQGPMSTAVFTAPLLATPLLRMSVATFSMQLASARQASIASGLSVPVRMRVATRTYDARSSAGAACAEYKLFKPSFNVIKAFGMPAVEHPFRFVVVLSAAFGLTVLATMSRHEPARARPGWMRLRSLPFASSDPPKIPTFAALRDA